MIFADVDGQAHARRWTNRQSAASAIRHTTRDVLIVAEALHEGAADDVSDVLAILTRQLTDVWGGELDGWNAGGSNSPSPPGKLTAAI